MAPIGEAMALQTHNFLSSPQPKPPPPHCGLSPSKCVFFLFIFLTSLSVIVSMCVLSAKTSHSKTQFATFLLSLIVPPFEFFGPPNTSYFHPLLSTFLMSLIAPPFSFFSPPNTSYFRPLLSTSLLAGRHSWLAGWFCGVLYCGGNFELPEARWTGLGH